MKKLIMMFLTVGVVFALQGCYYGDQNYFEESWVGADEDDTDVELIENYFTSKEETSQVNEETGLLENKNYISLLVESTDFKFFDPILTPTLWEIYNQSTVFENYYAVEFQQGATCNSEFMSMTGLYPFGGDSFSQNICDTYSENTFSYSLPNQLKSAGYDTYYFHSGYEDFYNRKVLIPGYGFETIKFQEDLSSDKGIDIDYAFDNESISFFEEYVDFSWYKNNNEHFYINYLSYSGHGKYSESIGESQRTVVDAFLIAKFGEEAAEMVDDTLKVYYEKIYEFELLVEKLVQLLKDEGVFYDTVITLTRDHQPYMLNVDVYNDYVENYLGYTGDSKIESYDILKNPFILYTPDEAAPIDEDDMTSNQTVETRAMTTVDIPPTMLNLLGVDRDYTYFAGSDVYSSTQNYVFIPISSEYDNLNLVTDGKYYYDSDGNHNLYSANGELLDIYLSTFEDKLEIKFLDQSFIVKILETDYFKLF